MMRMSERTNSAVNDGRCVEARQMRRINSSIDSGRQLCFAGRTGKSLFVVLFTLIIDVIMIGDFVLRVDKGSSKWMKESLNNRIVCPSLHQECNHTTQKSTQSNQHRTKHGLCKMLQPIAVRFDAKIENSEIDGSVHCTVWSQSRRWITTF